MASVWEHILGKGRTKILAPLVGGSDLSYRLLCRKYGAEITYTEMCQAYYFNNIDGDRKQGSVRMEFDDSDRPLILQVAATWTEAGEVIKMVKNPMFEGKIDGVDLNCGCPQGFALKRGIGAALPSKPDAFVELVAQISAGIAPLPLSVKLRLHENVETTVNLLKRLVDAGAQCITVHGRYAYQRGEKRGECDWNALRAVRDALPPHIPFIANGDIVKETDFRRIMDVTGARAGMCGYGALLNPGVFSPEDQAPSLRQMVSDYLTIARRHQNRLVDIQRHLAWMIKTQRLPKSVKGELFQARTLPDTVGVINGHLNLDIVLDASVVDRVQLRMDPNSMDPKHKALALKKERRYAKKTEERKRQREEKAARNEDTINNDNNDKRKRDDE